MLGQVTDEASTRSVEVAEGEVPRAELPAGGACSSKAQEGCTFGMLGGGSLTHKTYLSHLKVREGPRMVGLCWAGGAHTRHAPPSSMPAAAASAFDRQLPLG